MREGTTTRRHLAVAVLFALAGLSCHDGGTGPTRYGDTVLRITDVPMAVGSEWVYSVGIYDEFSDRYQRRLVGTDILRVTTEAADSSAVLGPGTAWVCATKTSRDTLFSYRRGNRITLVVPSLGDTIPLDFPLQLGSDLFRRDLELYAFGQDGSGDLLFMSFRHFHDPSFSLLFGLTKGIGIDYMSRSVPFEDALHYEYHLEDHAIGGGPHHSK